MIVWFVKIWMFFSFDFLRKRCPPSLDDVSVPLHTGISQSYISQWLLQQGLEMSDSKRRAFYRWYLLERTNPGESSDRSPPRSDREPPPGGERAGSGGVSRLSGRLMMIDY